MPPELMKFPGFLHLVALATFSAGISLSCRTTDTGSGPVRPNILFIPVDDLRPELGCYGCQTIKTPCIDRLATLGVTFERTYCQQAVCNPSRASLLTGLRPDSIRVWDLYTGFREHMPDVVTLPQYFKDHGYTSIGLGKTFHNNIPDSISWTAKPHIDGFPFDPDAVYLTAENLKIQEDKKQRMIAQGISRIDPLGHWYIKANAVEIADCSDEDYFDGAQTTLAIRMMKELAVQGKPFFLSVGYYRPHLPFNAPRKYWDLYSRDSVPLAGNQFVPAGSPSYAIHGDQELRSYDDCHDLPRPREQPWDVKRQRELVHGYYASVSYIDAQIGRLLDALDALDLARNTIVVLWGDHGWKLGEHNGWCKQTNYETDTRVPLIISGKGVKAKGSRCSALTEFVDIYPTLCEMAGFEVPEHLQGTSLVPLLADPALEWKQAAFSQFLLGRFGPPSDRLQERMGYAIRTDRYRYVEWFAWDRELEEKGELLNRELFDHESDPGENVNIAGDPAHGQTVEELSLQLERGWRYAVPGDHPSHFNK
jgi:iduronate 2-sulfatase